MTVPLLVAIAKSAPADPVEKVKVGPEAPLMVVEATVIPRLEVETHCVPVPVVCSTMPDVPAVPLALNAPVRLRAPATDKVSDGDEVPMPTFPAVYEISDPLATQVVAAAETELQLLPFETYSSEVEAL